MKKYAFPFTLGLVCFVGGYAVCYSKMTAAYHAKESRRNSFEMSLQSGRLKASGPRAMAMYLVPAPGVRIPNLPVLPTLEGWNQGLIAPMIPPKVVAP